MVTMVAVEKGLVEFCAGWGAVVGGGGGGARGGTSVGRVCHSKTSKESSGTVGILVRKKKSHEEERIRK